MMDAAIEKLLHQGAVIPAHPLALDRDLKLDEMRQRRLTRYYLASGVGGLAVGVHTTQFAIRRPGVQLLEAVLQLAAEEITAAQPDRPVIKIAGVCGDTAQAVKEAALALKYGYDLGLVSLGALQNQLEDELIAHIREITAVIPVFGFYLQPAAGGRILSYGFWEKLTELPGVHAIKIAPFNRYQTLDVVRAVCHSSRQEEIALYTGNDDHIVADLLATYAFNVNGKVVEKRFAGGLLGHWSVWTHAAVELFGAIKTCIRDNYSTLRELLIKGIMVTDMNAAIFDPAHGFSGSIAGIHEVLRRQGLLEGTWCLDPGETLSPGQSREIDRVTALYPQLIDDVFVQDFLKKDRPLPHPKQLDASSC
ncbi:MAG TPA: dihydrodipicolinate synthase family protein [Chitinophagaceae bacterium]|nr:dihydrodipicolinate synthase family protein [Chitinophagaceae bacterium]